MAPRELPALPPVQDAEDVPQEDEEPVQPPNQEQLPEAEHPLNQMQLLGLPNDGQLPNQAQLPNQGNASVPGQPQLDPALEADVRAALIEMRNNLAHMGELIAEVQNDLGMIMNQQMNQQMNQD